MDPTATSETRLDPAAIPPAVLAVVDALAEAGHATCLVGGCVRDLLRGRQVAEFDVTTAAPPAVLLELFPRAVPIGLRHGTLMLPSEHGPIDVTSFRAGPRLEDDLAHRDFTVNAIAYDPRRGELVDPFEGRADLAAGRLRAVGSARERFAEDPLRAVRAARLAATLGLDVDPAVEAAMAEAREALRGVARERVRRELGVLLLGAQAGRGLALLRRTGLECDLAPDAPADAAAVVDALPAELELRLAGWLRGTRVGAVLRRNRFPRRSGQRVIQLLQLHPIEAGVDPERDAAVRRLMHRAGEENLASLFALRRSELRCGDAASRPDAPEARKRLAEIEAACERVRRAEHLVLRRQELAIDGRRVMEVLGRGPGPEIGRALAYLTERVLDDPSHNTPEALAALLREWSARRGDA